MPLLYLHLSIAKDAADMLDHPVIGSQLGSYLGGVISPDAHFVSSASRSDTHFFDLQASECESGASSIFKTNPGLARGSDIDAATKSFVAGYLSHLITDEIWTLDIYRPFFGDTSPLGGDIEANTLDRLLQYETDRWERQDKEKLALIRAELCSWKPDEEWRFEGLAELCLRHHGTRGDPGRFSPVRPAFPHFKREGRRGEARAVLGSHTHQARLGH